MDRKQTNTGINSIQYMYLNRLRTSKKKICICFDGQKQLNDARILAFDMYTVLVEAPVAVKNSDRFENRQILIYKNSISSIIPENTYTPIDMDRYNKGE